MAGELAYRDGAPVLMSDLHYGLARARVVNAQLSGLRIWGSDFLGGLLRADTAQLTGEVASSAVRSFLILRHIRSAVAASRPEV